MTKGAADVSTAHTTFGEDQAGPVMVQLATGWMRLSMLMVDFVT